MKKLLSPKLIALANALNKPLYVVGGAVRDFLIDGALSADIDIASACHLSEISKASEKLDIKILGEYKRTGTAVLFDGVNKYEYTRFRKDVYGQGGEHTPEYTAPTEDILEDALRRDFKCNAVYYDIVGERFVSPLDNGVEDIKNKVLSTVKRANEVFCHDGLRLMRLARFSAELNFTPNEECIKGAFANRNMILDISKERVYEELTKILVADTKHSFSNKAGHYVGLKLLEKIGVLELILPELCLGKGMKQRPDYHNHDVLEHSLRCALYARKDIRLYALLHDIAKPYCFNKDGNFYMHAFEGEKMVENALARLKAPNKVIEEAKFLVKYHMLNLDQMKQGKLRRFIADNFDKMEKLLEIKRADYRALKDEDLPKDYLKRATDLIAQMQVDGTPVTLKQLKISAEQLIEQGYSGKEIGKRLKELRDACVLNPKLNDKEELYKMIKKGKKV